MPKLTKNHSLPPSQHGTPEAIPSQSDTAEAAASKDEAAAESQVASATPDGPEAAAKSPASHDAIGNSDLPEQPTEAQSSPAEPGTAVPTSPQDDTSEAGAAKDDYGAENQVPAAPPNTAENQLPLTAEPCAEKPAKLDDGECFGPVIPKDRVSSAPKPAPKAKPSPMAALSDRRLRDMGIDPTPTGATPETASPAPVPAQGKGDTEMAQPSEILTAPVPAPLPPPPVAKAVELFNWIMQVLRAVTLLRGDAAALVVFWVIQDWFQQASDVRPCLVITGPAQSANDLLHFLHEFCLRPALLAELRRSDLQILGYYGTHLIWEPNLDKRTANLLSSLTDRDFLIVSSPNNIARYSKSTAIYAGENPETHKIQNSIHIHMTPTNAKVAAMPQGLKTMIDRIQDRLRQYQVAHSRVIESRQWSDV